MANKIENFFAPSIDPRFNILNQATAVDCSNSNLIIRRQPPNSGSAGANGFNYNGGTVYFDISNGGNDLRENLNGMAVIGKWHAQKSNGNPVDRNTVGIEPDLACAAIKSIRCHINSSSEPIEVYSNANYGDALKVRHLLTMSNQMLESGAGGACLPPYFSSNLDTKTTFSIETLARSATFLAGPNQILYNSFRWSLPWLFSFATVPALSSILRIQLYIDWQPQDQVLFKMTSNADTNLFIIDDIVLETDSTRMTTIQNSLEIKEQVSGSSAQNFLFPYYDTISQTYTGSSTLICTGVSNLQAAVLLFPSTSCSSQGVNRYQYMPNDLSSVNANYKSMSVPQTQVPLSVTQPSQNIEIYNMYIRTCNLQYSENFVAAIPFESGFGASMNPYTDASQYLYCFPFNAGLLPTLSDASDLQIYTSQSYSGDPHNASTNCSCIIVRIRLIAYQVKPDGSTQKFFT